jgi:TatD DNase family protein
MADLEAVLDRAEAAGVLALVTAGSDVESSSRAVALAERYPQVYAAVGVHPHHADQLNVSALKTLRRLCGHPKVVAIGEIGLDFYRKLVAPEVQERALLLQLELASELGLPVVLHSRQATEAMLGHLGPWADREAGRNGPRLLGLRHCFDGAWEEASWYGEHGFLVSFAGNTTYRANSALREVAARLPLEWLAVETDAPLLPPQRWRGRRNEPAYLWDTVECIAAARRVPAETVAGATLRNVVQLFRLPIGVSV